MTASSEARAALVVHPATAERWPDLEALFGERGACGGCWCMLWHMGRVQFERQKGAENKRAHQAIVESGPAPGLLGYADSWPIAWCAVGPRDAYPALERSRVLARVDGAPVWSIVCLFVARPFRRQRLTVPLLKAAVEYAEQRGARIVEGYPVEPKTANMPAAFAWTGTASAFRQAGFTEAARRSPLRPIMRFILNDSSL